MSRNTMPKVSDLRDETASKIFAIFTGVLANNLIHTTASVEEIERILFREASERAHDAIKLADIFVKELEKNNA